MNCPNCKSEITTSSHCANLPYSLRENSPTITLRSEPEELVAVAAKIRGCVEATAAAFPPAYDRHEYLFLLSRDAAGHFVSGLMDEDDCDEMQDEIAETVVAMINA